MEIDPRRALTVPEFCWLEHLSKSKFFELKRRGLAPTTTDVDGLQRISPQSREDWHERMAALAKSEAAQVEAERRRELAAVAGRAAAASPNHVSKNRSVQRRGGEKAGDVERRRRRPR
jgi:hypothetical protein